MQVKIEEQKHRILALEGELMAQQQTHAGAAELARKVSERMYVCMHACMQQQAHAGAAELAGKVS
jgi:hypothetical protein